MTIDRETSLPRPSGLFDSKRVTLLVPGEGEERTVSRHLIYPTTSVLDLIRETTIPYPQHFLIDVGGQLYPGGAKVYDEVKDDTTVYLIPDEAVVG